MFRKFLDGLAFGAGFALAFFAVYGIAAFLFMRTITSITDVDIPPLQSSDAEPFERSTPAEPLFHDLTLEEKIREASVIAVVRYQPADDGRMVGVFEELLKREPGTTFHYGIGDEYPHAAYYPSGDVGYGDGQIVFFTGSPAEMRFSATFEGDRVGGLADIPLKLLREKCAAPT